ncbi:hypothetical protein NMG60_11029776 [Bertholletia excelsa]
MGKGDEKKGKEEKGLNFLEQVTVEFKVSMHCNACERTIAKAISKIKGVERFVTDMRGHRVIVTGRINPHKAVKKLKKKTGKKVELVIKKKQENPKEVEEERGSSSVVPLPYCVTKPMVLGYRGDNNNLLDIFSDENPNACSMM